MSNTHTILSQHINKTVWVFVKPNTKWVSHPNTPIERTQILGRIQRVTERELILTDDCNFPRSLSLDSIERAALTNKEYHIKFLLAQLEYITVKDI